MGNGKNYNSGIDVLKVLACFGVVLLHFGHDVKVATLSVPIFMFVSAYLCGRLFTEGTWRELFIRLRRLYVPFAVWGVSYWLMFCLFNRRFDIVVLIKQLAIGAPACPVLYFLFLLACYSIMLFYVGHMRRRFWTLPLVLVICLTLQYSGLNATVFNRCSFDLRMVLGRFVELLPSAVLGYAFYFIGKTRVTRGVSFVVAVVPIAVYSMSVGGVFAMVCDGFQYQGAPLLLGAAGVSVAFVSGLSSVKGAGFIHDIAQLTPGVYYVHLLVGKLVESAIGRHRGWLEAVIVFVVSALCAFVMKRIRYMEDIVK